jgi:transcriptional regulator with XRE-family HTH domain
MVLGKADPIQYRIGMNKLRAFREKAGLSQAQLAKAVGSYQSRIAAFEKNPGSDGYRRVPLETAREIAVVLDCMLTDLRPDLLSTGSIDVLLEGSPKELRDEIRDYAIYKLAQRR